LNRINSFCDSEEQRGKEGDRVAVLVLYVCRLSPFPSTVYRLTKLSPTIPGYCRQQTQRDGPPVAKFSHTSGILPRLNLNEYDTYPSWHQNLDSTSTTHSRLKLANCTVLSPTIRSITRGDAYCETTEAKPSRYCSPIFS
jgi:hypothetical protein